MLPGCTFKRDVVSNSFFMVASHKGCVKSAEITLAFKMYSGFCINYRDHLLVLYHDIYL